jgi:hypothetical protein
MILSALQYLNDLVSITKAVSGDPSGPEGLPGLRLDAGRNRGAPRGRFRLSERASGSGRRERRVERVALETAVERRCTPQLDLDAGVVWVGIGAWGLGVWG